MLMVPALEDPDEPDRAVQHEGRGRRQVLLRLRQRLQLALERLELGGEATCASRSRNRAIVRCRLSDAATQLHQHLATIAELGEDPLELALRRRGEASIRSRRFAPCMMLKQRSG